MIRLKELREKSNMTQKEIAELLRVKPATISRYENGTNEPDAKTLIWYADYFGCSTDYILGRTDDPNVHIKIAPTEFGDAIVEVYGEDDLTPDEIRGIRRILAERQIDKKDS